MKYIIIEDEDPAAIRLEKMVQQLLPDSVMVNHLVSVKSAIAYLKDNPNPDLIFMDIQLGDGNSFEILDVVSLKSPIIFTTAFDQFAIKAFKVNSIDYILKPIKIDELEKALAKYQLHAIKDPVEQVDYKKLVQLIKDKSDLQKRILIRFGDIIKAIEISDVAYFYTENKINFLYTFDSKSYPIDQNLDQIEAIVDATQFFRINRQFIVNIRAISKMVSYSKSRVKLILEPESAVETIVSTDRSPHFKAWLTGSAS